MIRAVPANASSQSTRCLYLARIAESPSVQTVELVGSAYSRTNMGIWGGWTPSGDAVLIATSGDTGQTVQTARVLLVDSKNGNSRKVTTVEDLGKATWSEDGKRIFFTKWRPNPEIWGGFDLYVMNSDGSGKRLLIENIEDPDW